jgi:hypothetical protein
LGAGFAIGFFGAEAGLGADLGAGFATGFFGAGAGFGAGLATGLEAGFTGVGLATGFLGAGVVFAGAFAGAGFLGAATLDDVFTEVALDAVLVACCFVAMMRIPSFRWKSGKHFSTQRRWNQLET